MQVSAAQPPQAGASPFDIIRRRYLLKLHQHTGNNVIAYTSSWTTTEGGGPAASINAEDVQALMEVVHGLQGDNLDLIVHSPGGSAEATEAVVAYLRKKFSRIRVFVPQAAMSAATMLACAADEIVMGRHSSIGPIDPQLVVLIEGQIVQAPAAAIKAQFEQAQKECMDDPRKLPSWIPMLRQYGPALLAQCNYHEDLAKSLVGSWLAKYMFRGEADASTRGKRIAAHLADHQHFKTHGRFIDRDQASALGLRISNLEADQVLQDLVLSVFHSSTLTFSSTPTIKIVENHLGRAFVKANREIIINIPRGDPAGPTHRVAGRLLQQLYLGEPVDVPTAHVPVCRVPIAEQLAALQRLGNGWLDGVGTKYSTTSLGRAREILEPLVVSFGLPTPYLYPTPEGEIRAEWPTTAWDVVLTFDPEVTRAELVANATTRDETEEATYAADLSGMLSMSAKLGRLLRPEAG